LGIHIGGGGLGSSSADRSSSKQEVITRVRFNALGNKIAAATESGRVLLWVFAARPVGTSSVSASSDLSQLSAYDCIDGAHNRGVNDLVWVSGSSAGGLGGNGNIIATAGEASNHLNVCLWSVLLPAEDRLLCSFACHEKDGGAASIAHCATSNLLVVGAAKGGALLVFSLNSMQLVRRLDTGRSARIHRLTYDPMADMLLAGSADGAFRVRQTYADAGFELRQPLPMCTVCSFRVGFSLCFSPILCSDVVLF
jgi:WD40 repeat protein